HIHVLVTTRLDSASLPGLRSLPVGVLSSHDALALLRTVRPVSDSPEDAESRAARAIARRLGGHALATELAGVLLSEFNLSYVALLSRLDQDSALTLENLSAPGSVDDKIQRVEDAIARLLEPILASLSALESRAMEYAALLPADRLPLTWLHDLLLRDFPEGDRAHHLPHASAIAEPRTSEPIGDQRTSRTVVAPIAGAFERLERLRLIVPATADQPSDSSASAAPARIQRLVQGLVRKRMKFYVDTLYIKTINEYTDARGELLASQPADLVPEWELLCLREAALSRIAQGDRGGLSLADRIADPLIKMGRTLDLRELWRLSVDSFRERLQTQPDDAEHAFFLARCLQRLGTLAQMLDDPVGARRYHTEGLRFLNRLVASFPESREFAHDLSISHEEMGDLERSAGALDEAKQHYQISLSIARRLADCAPAHLDRAVALARSLEQLGDLATTAGHPDEAPQPQEEGPQDHKSS
ncbi:MAG: hypothetical protein ACP5XB_15900, partial [Isosphaeraceae bacterium]